jgi:hypothetical protein
MMGMPVLFTWKQNALPFRQRTGALHCLAFGWRTAGYILYNAAGGHYHAGRWFEDVATLFGGRCAGTGAVGAAILSLRFLLHTLRHTFFSSPARTAIITAPHRPIRHPPNL